EQFKPLLQLLPVTLADNRLLDRDASNPWRLNFPAAGKNLPFMDLSGDGKGGVSGWEEFHYGPGADKNKPVLLRGSFRYSPVKAVKPAAVVAATFRDPAGRLEDGKEQPYLVQQAVGKGRVIWIGSAETWRLRQYEEAFHERFWKRLIEF